MNSIKFFCVVLFLLGSASFVANAGSIKDKIQGKWEVSAPDAPYGYQNFKLDVKEKDGIFKMDVKGDAILNNQTLSLKDEKFTANVFVAENVKVTIWEEKGIINGSAETSTGKLPLKFKAIK